MSNLVTRSALPLRQKQALLLSIQGGFLRLGRSRTLLASTRWPCLTSLMSLRARLVCQSRSSGICCLTPFTMGQAGMAMTIGAWTIRNYLRSGIAFPYQSEASMIWRHALLLSPQRSLRPSRYKASRASVKSWTYSLVTFMRTSRHLRILSAELS